ncbi:hypothetical protein [Cyclobacterium plantarum]|uniref:hypothetical protein n=1 Tax=Cyclobacterium plantarum TaxID=2716263 RepID=UPI003F710678
MKYKKLCSTFFKIIQIKEITKALPFSFWDYYPGKQLESENQNYLALFIQPEYPGLNHLFHPLFLDQDDLFDVGTTG